MAVRSRRGPQPRALDIGQFIDPGTLRSDFGAYLQSFETTVGRRWRTRRGRADLVDSAERRPERSRVLPDGGIPEAGYEVPNTWDELIALSRSDRGRRGHAVVLRLQVGLRHGWPGTDFIESLVLRSGGVETYDAWTTGEIGFASPEVMAAGRLAHELIFGPGFVRGGAAGISEQWFDVVVLTICSKSTK